MQTGARGEFVRIGTPRFDTASRRCDRHPPFQVHECCMRVAHIRRGDDFRCASLNSCPHGAHLRLPRAATHRPARPPQWQLQLPLSGRPSQTRARLPSSERELRRELLLALQLVGDSVFAVCWFEGGGRRLTSWRGHAVGFRVSSCARRCTDAHCGSHRCVLVGSRVDWASCLAPEAPSGRRVRARNYDQPTNGELLQ